MDIKFVHTLSWAHFSSKSSLPKLEGPRAPGRGTAGLHPPHPHRLKTTGNILEAKQPELQRLLPVT